MDIFALRNQINVFIRWGVLVVLLILPSQHLFSQKDSLYVSNIDTIRFNSDSYHSPHKATFYSAVLPGLGQAYNKKYWKIPLLYAGLGGVIYGISFNTKYYNQYKNAYRDFIIRDPANKSYARFAEKVGLTNEEVETTHAVWFENALRNKKEFYKRNRDLSYIGLMAVYMLNLIDASVDAHFYNYDISDNLSLRIEPQVINTVSYGNRPDGLGLQLQLNF